MEIVVSEGLTADSRQIRNEVFVEEQGFVHEFDETDLRAVHAVLYIDGTPQATGRIFPKPGDASTYILGRIAVRKTARGTGLGSAIMRTLEQHAAACGAEKTELLAQVQAQPFYESLGYTACGEVVCDEGCPHIWMQKRTGCKGRNA